MTEMTFEEAMARLSEITVRMEDPALPLEEMKKLYTEGRKLYAKCRSCLDQTEKELIVLAEDPAEPTV